jgi:membrane associated rhomboid family serine protease
MRIVRQPSYRPATRRYRINNAVYWLIGINALVFAIMYFLGEFSRGRMGIGPLTYVLSMIPVKVMQGWVWTFVTYMFVHGGFTHILFNMLALFIFGTQVERYMGSGEFLLFYFVTGVLAGVFSFAVYYFTHTYVAVLMGASGAIFAVELAFAVFYPDSIIYLWGILPLRAPVMVLGFTALELFYSIFGLNQSVAHLTHLAGFGFAWLYFVIRFRINPWKRLFNR